MTEYDNDITRREFIHRSIKAGAAITITCAGAALLYDSRGPGFKKQKLQVQLPDFSIDKIPGKTLAIVKGQGRKQALQKSIDLLGGIKRFIKPDDRVIIKPNIAFATSPSLGATSHPDIIHAMIELCFSAGAKEVSVLDNPINDPAGCYMLSGIEEAVKKTRGTLIYPEQSLFQNMTLDGGRLIRNWPVLHKPLEKATKLIGMAPVKNHHRSGASMSMKNWYGLLGGRRNIFHQDIHTIITELAMLIKPTLVILDGFDVMMTNGPTGGSLSDLKRMNTLIAGTDQVAVDSFGATLLGMTPNDLPYLGKADRAGVGISDYKSLKPLYGGV